MRHSTYIMVLLKYLSVMDNSYSVLRIINIKNNML